MSNYEMSKGAQKIFTILKKSHIPVQLEYTFPTLKSFKGAPLRYDFAIKYNN